MIVGMTMRISETEHEIRDTISHDWFNYFKNKNIKILIIPNLLSDPISYVKQFKVNRLLFTGGDSIGPSSFSKSNKLKTHRDILEEKLFDWGFKYNIPIFGVCRGMQLINVCLGGSITKNLMKYLNNEIHVSSEHNILTSKGNRFLVNSFHNEGIFENQVAKSLKIFAKSEEGIVEGLIHKNKKITGIQWHPERKSKNKNFNQNLIDSWLDLK